METILQEFFAKFMAYFDKIDEDEKKLWHEYKLKYEEQSEKEKQDKIVLEYRLAKLEHTFTALSDMQYILDETTEQIESLGDAPQENIEFLSKLRDVFIQNNISICKNSSLTIDEKESLLIMEQQKMVEFLKELSGNDPDIAEKMPVQIQQTMRELLQPIKFH